MPTLTLCATTLNVGRHGLCWVHAERLVHKLETFTDEQRVAQRRIRALIWWFYRDLKAYHHHPTKQRKAAGTPVRERWSTIERELMAACDKLRIPDTRRARSCNGAEVAAFQAGKAQ